MVDNVHRQKYLEQLAASLRTRNFSEDLVSYTVAEVEADLETSGQDPVEALGEPQEFAEKIEAQLTAGGRDPAGVFEEPSSFAQRAWARLEALETWISRPGKETSSSRRAQARTSRPKTLAGKVLRGTLSLLRALFALVLYILFLGVACCTAFSVASGWPGPDCGR